MKFHPKKIILKNVQFPIHINLDHFQKEAAFLGVNLSVLGRPNCNIRDEKDRIVRDPSVDDETEEYLKESHCLLHRGNIVRIEFDVTEDGDFVNCRFPKKIRKYKEVMKDKNKHNKD
jgi:hypothetical protein